MEIIIERYKRVLQQKILQTGYEILVIKPVFGNETSDMHLMWMLCELLENRDQSETKKHRWLGFIQGVMICKGYLTVTEERELTRPILNGK